MMRPLRQQGAPAAAPFPDLLRLMTERDADCVRFTPSRIYGLPGADEVAVFSDRLEIRLGGFAATYQFSNFARRQESALVYWLKRLFFVRTYRTVADRDWFREPPDRYFIFYTNPAITICMPLDEPKDYALSYFLRFQQMMMKGGYATNDLG